MIVQRKRVEQNETQRRIGDAKSPQCDGGAEINRRVLLDGGDIESRRRRLGGKTRRCCGERDSDEPLTLHGPSISRLLLAPPHADTVRLVAHIAVPGGIPGIRSLFAVRPEVAAPISALTDILLHAANALSRGERELIAAYVSSLNDCTFCYHSHAAIASCHVGDDGALVRAVVDDVERAPVSPKVKALLAIAARVQRSGREVRDTDIARARTEGATDLDIHDTVLIAAAFCMFNRYVDGLGAWTPADPAAYRERARHVAEHGYSASLPPVPTTR